MRHQDVASWLRVDWDDRLRPSRLQQSRIPVRAIVGAGIPRQSGLGAWLGACPRRRRFGRVARGISGPGVREPSKISTAACQGDHACDTKPSAHFSASNEFVRRKKRSAPLEDPTIRCQGPSLPFERPAPQPSDGVANLRLRRSTSCRAASMPSTRSSMRRAGSCRPFPRRACCACSSRASIPSSTATAGSAVC